MVPAHGHAQLWAPPAGGNKGVSWISVPLVRTAGLRRDLQTTLAALIAHPNLVIGPSRNPASLSIRILLNVWNYTEYMRDMYIHMCIYIYGQSLSQFEFNP